MLFEMESQTTWWLFDVREPDEFDLNGIILTTKIPRTF